MKYIKIYKWIMYATITLFFIQLVAFIWGFVSSPLFWKGSATLIVIVLDCSISLAWVTSEKK